MTGRNYVVYRFDCPEGTVFDERFSVCNWPDQSAPCDQAPGPQPGQGQPGQGQPGQGQPGQGQPGQGQPPQGPPAPPAGPQPPQGPPGGGQPAPGPAPPATDVTKPREPTTPLKHRVFRVQTRDSSGILKIVTDSTGASTNRKAGEATSFMNLTVQLAWSLTRG
ncbi:hypothetical protein MTO96_048111 [Rhipicephalus appendiculatus]